MADILSFSPAHHLKQAHALLLALQENDRDRALSAIRAGADLTVSSLKSSTPYRALEVAIILGRDRLALALIDAGAPLGDNSNAKDRATSQKCNPFTLASKRGKERIMKAIGERLTPERLIEQVDDRLGMSILREELVEVQALLNVWPESASREARGKLTPLHLAATTGNTDIIDLLLLREAKWETDCPCGTPSDYLRTSHPQLLGRYALPRAMSNPEPLKKDNVVRFVPKARGA